MYQFFLSLLMYSGEYGSQFSNILSVKKIWLEPTAQEKWQQINVCHKLSKTSVTGVHGGLVG